MISGKVDKFAGLEKVQLLETLALFMRSSTSNADTAHEKIEQVGARLITIKGNNLLFI